MAENANVAVRSAGRSTDRGVSSSPASRTGSLLTAERTLVVVSELSRRRSLRVYEVAALLGVSRPAAHRLLATLVSSGYAVQEDTGHRYLPGPGLAAIAEQTPARASRVAAELKERARVALSMLRDELDETLHVAVRQGNGVHFIEGVRGRTEPAGPLRTGILLPAHATAAGKAALAGLTDDAVRALYPRGLLNLTPHSLQSVDELLDDLARVRRRGFALNAQESQAGICGVAVQAAGSVDRVGVTVVLTAPSVRLTPERSSRIVPRLQRAAEILGS